MASNLRQRAPQSPVDSLSEASPTQSHERRSRRNEEREVKSTFPSWSKYTGGSREALRSSFEDTGAFLLLLLLDITKMVLQLMKQPIAIVLVGYILIVSISYTASYIASLAIHGLSPLCSLPLITTMVPICRTITSSSSSPPKQGLQIPQYPDLVNLQTRFESVMESSGMGISLAMSIKSSEMAVRDLNTLVKLSDLISKDLLASSLDEFVSSAKDASRHLTRLDSGVGGAVDSILAMDDYAIKSLEAIVQHEKSNNVLNSVLFPFSSSVATRKKLMETFNQAAGLMESNLRRLIEAALATTNVLNNLESRLLIIHEIVSREEGNTKLRREEVLADLWTYVGANRAKLANFASHRDLLSQVAAYRSAAAVQVGGTLVQLEKLAADLDDLRERVATPLLSEEASIPIEVHIMTLRKGVERLTEGRGRAKRREEQVRERILEGPQYPELGTTSSTPDTSTDDTHYENCHGGAIEHLDRVIIESPYLVQPMEAVRDALCAILQVLEGINVDSRLTHLMKLLQLHLATIENQISKLDKDFKIDNMSLPLNSVVQDAFQSYASHLRIVSNALHSGTMSSVDSGDAEHDLPLDRIDDLDVAFRAYTRTVHNFVGSTVDQIRPDFSQPTKAATRENKKGHFTRLRTPNVYGIQHAPCLVGTRTKTLNSIRHWVEDDSSSRMFCLLDFAGSGKSTVAKTVTQEWTKQRVLMARFFFSRDSAETMSTGAFCTTVANAFASGDTLYKATMKEFQRHPDYLLFPFEEQFEGLITTPLKALNRRVILVIDALDECDNSYHDRDQLLATLADQLHSIEHVRVFVTGRPEIDIKHWATTTAGIHCTNFIQLEGNHDDVERYIDHRLRNRLPKSQGQLRKIVCQAEGVFIWARIACDLICQTINVKGLLDSLGMEVTLDHLYLIALEQSVPEDKYSRQAAVMILEMILAVKEPLTIAELEQLSPGSDVVEKVVTCLSSVLLHKDRNDPIRLLHTTFREFLTSALKAKQWFADVGLGHYSLATGCIAFLDNRPRPDHPKWEKELKRKVHIAVSKSLADWLHRPFAYSSALWAYHCEKSRRGLGLNEKITRFMEKGHKHSLYHVGYVPSHQFKDLKACLASLCGHNMSPSITSTLITNTLELMFSQARKLDIDLEEGNERDDETDVEEEEEDEDGNNNGQVMYPTQATLGGDGTQYYPPAHASWKQIMPRNGVEGPIRRSMTPTGELMLSFY
ncbi:hypothetical protein FRC17_006830 [Serendipita sp. 399]|nr:hypothetical protein FRC17_006830 [Serendipita sp. 399]